MLHYRPEKSGRIITCCAVLHNICIAAHPDFIPEEFHNLRNVLHHANNVPEEPARVVLVRGEAERRRIVDVLEARRNRD